VTLLKPRCEKVLPWLTYARVSEWLDKDQE
jgi:hypothetical protein